MDTIDAIDNIKSFLFFDIALKDFPRAYGRFLCPSLKTHKKLCQTDIHFATCVTNHLDL